MRETETILWGIHAGRTGDADTLFLKSNCIAIGWAKMGDLSALKPDRDAFKARLAEMYPESQATRSTGFHYRWVSQSSPSCSSCGLGTLR